ncbi:uncharacterized protein Z520_10694 [Fonsecaea multimorphosa CBS 102226]|uniref:Nephrocystin 3-like N-terminal domain-containing protein n=1 Tax=Fonsecaea multimorphosa CBS 102226 TaxID=1442371 RepID=A0A0D2I8J8_9EURO|nr:uncharacterized protein Z520_10694 [Fonsecaea multimorphosa CBS 102226]KIX93516.1 hypothetical protein Z520_10694 [Fonsecaea multimorphosa CBS 102226]OAL18831.1 hypothetical protein AYO22_10160 [Fonsecaea multimorphosa]
MASSSSRGQPRAEPDRLPSQDALENTEAARGPSATDSVPSQRQLPHILDDGITELWCPPNPAHVVADIYFVHGLMGHPFKTWYHPKAASAQKSQDNPESKKYRLSKIFGRKHEDRRETSGNSSVEPSPKERGCYWPLDLIPSDFENVRVLTCGYDSHPTRFLAGGNQMNISQHAQNLLQRIRTTRSHCQGRPIIFVAHSLGGILVEDAIIESRKYEDQPAVMDISRSSVAIFFFGTPHHGSDAAKYGEYLGKILETCGVGVNKQILRGLQRNGEKLSSVERDFNDLINKPIPASEKLQICSFQEGKTVTGLKFFPIGKVVEDSSSCFNRRDIETSFFINENHMGMTRLQSAQTQGYVDFRSMLREYLQKIGTTTNAQRLREQRQEDERAALMKALDFADRSIREQQLSSLDTPEETFTWIWASPFKTWLENESSIFWISGKPASGKSTLMNYIRKASNTRNILNNCSRSNWSMIYFFFDFRAGSGIGNSMEGFLRSLLRQLCEELPIVTETFPELAKLVTRPSQPQPATSSEGHIPLDILRTALLRGIRSCSDGLMILLDGLDEYEGEQVGLCNFIKALRGDNVKICIASRPDPPFPDAFAGLPSFRMQDLNLSAIKKFGLHVLEQFYSGRQDVPSTLQSLADDVARRSQGVFLWARFAIFELIKGLTRGEKLGSAALTQRLEEMPPELQQIYSRIFHRSPRDERKLAGLILLLICYKMEEITSEMLQIAISSLPPSSPLYPGPATLAAARGGEDESSRRLLVVTGGTVEEYTARVEIGRNTFLGSLPRLIHRTVRTYLERGGWEEILDDIYSPELGYKTWTEICTQTIMEGEPNLAHLQSLSPSVLSDLRLTIRDDHSDDYDINSDGGESVSSSQQSFLDNPDESPGSIATSHRSGDVDFQPGSANKPRVDKFTPQTMFLGYAATNVLSHASSYEEASVTSSSVLIEALGHPPFVNFHRAVSGEMRCFDSCWRIHRSSEARGFRTEFVQFAIAHGLHYYVKDYVRELKERQPSKSSNYIVHRVLKMMDLKRTPDPAKMIRLLKEAAVLSAFQEGSWKPTGNFLSTASFLLKQCPIVEDAEIMGAVGNRAPKLLRLLLKYRAGDIRLLNVRTEEAALYLDTSTRWSQSEGVHPFVALDYALYLMVRDDFHKATQEVIAILMERGVQINGSCGPLGGVLHYIINEVPDNPHADDIVRFIDLLKGKGADINQLGRQGTPLEFLWELANTREVANWERATCRAVLRNLIAHGGVNRRKDPNGLVPSVIQMELFACNWTDYQECIRFYRQGPRDGGSVWPGPVPLHPDDWDMGNGYYDFPFGEAMRKYRAAMGMESVDNGGVDGDRRGDVQQGQID